MEESKDEVMPGDYNEFGLDGSICMAEIQT